jgi:hypothetical protein
MRSGGGISIWFFIGISLLVNGILILGSGVYELVHPPQLPVVLFNLHASIWWGALLVLIGAMYCVKYFPSASQQG